MKEEFEATEINKTWELTILSSNKKTINVRWVFKTKLKPDGSVTKHKAKLVARGFLQKSSLYYFEEFAPVAGHETIWLIISFINGQLQEEVYVL